MICNPSRRDPLQERRERVAEFAKRYISILRRRGKKEEPEPALQIAIERTRQRLNEIHSVGQRYLPDAPIRDTRPVIRVIRRSEDGAAR